MKWRGALLLASVAASLELQAGAAAELEERSHSLLRAETKVKAQRPPQFLLVSSPRGQKVCFSTIKPGESAGSVVTPLIDAGLMAPEGIAVDRKRGKLFVADPAVQKVYQYTIEVRNGVLISDNRQLTIMENMEVHWLAVDQMGDLYLTGALSNQVLTIPLSLLMKLESGEVLSSNMKTESEAAAAAAQLSAANAALEKEGKPTPMPPADSTIMVLYQKGDTVTGIESPAGIAADGINVYWGNGGGGTAVGSIVEGARAVTADSTHPLASNTNSVFGVATSSNSIFYSDSTQFVYGVKKAGGDVVTMASSLQSPRGLAWDGDGTVFVADQAGSMVYSFPSGRLAPTQTSRVTQLHDAYGLAVVSMDDAFALAGNAAVYGLVLFAAFLD